MNTKAGKTAISFYCTIAIICNKPKSREFLPKHHLE